MYDPAFETLLDFIPKKEHSRFKALLANRRALELETKLQDKWVYYPEWDFIRTYEKEKYKLIASDFPEKLSNTMYIYGDIVVFIENKGTSAQFYPKATVLKLSKGFIRI